MEGILYVLPAELLLKEIRDYILGWMSYCAGRYTLKMDFVNVHSLHYLVRNLQYGHQSQLLRCMYIQQVIFMM